MASREEAYDGARGFYDNDVLAARVWTDKYAAHDKDGDFKETSPADTHERFLTYFPGDTDVGQAVRNGWFIPAGRIQFTMGNRYIKKSTQLNCYVIPIKDDSIEAIFECAKEMARTYSYGGGCGIDIGCLRFSGATVNNTAITSSGSASFMDMFSNVTGTIGQHGRRGALMITIPVHHPDARLFMRMKDDLDPKLLVKASAELKNYLYEHRTAGHANVSIKLTDEFMKAVEGGEQFRLHWESKDGRITHEEWVDARDYWSEICHQAWKQAEPGLLFWDRMVEESPSNQYEGGEILTTNPCFTGEMRLHTSDGMMTFADLSRLGIDNIVVADNRITATTVNPDCRGTVGRKATPVRLTASQQQIFKLTTNHGHELRCTAYHEFPTPEGRKQLKDLKVGDTLLLQSGEGQWGTMGDYDDGLILGSLTGDGNISRRKKGGPFSVRLSFWNEPDMAARLETIVKDRVVSVSPRSLETAVGIVDVPDRHEQRIGSEVLYRYMHDRYGIDKDSKKRVPECIWQGSREFVRGYLASFFQADGSVQLFGHAKSQTLSVRLAQSNPELLRDVQVLLGNFGIVSSVYLRRKAQKRRLPNGKGGHKAYHCKPQYELVINRPNAIVFEKEVGFAGGKQAQLAEAFSIRGFDCRKPERFVTTVNSVKADGTEDVYCLTELETHSIVVNGVVTAQCGEQPLPPYDSCNLGSVNLRHMVRDAWTVAAEVDWDRFELSIRAGVRFLDKVRTIEKEEGRFPLKEQEAASELFRRIGVGIMGFGEMLASLGFVYGSDESLGFAEKLFEFMRNKAYDESVELAKELGSFPAFDWERHRQCPFVQRLPEALQSKIAEHGIRNVTVLSFAPTGTIAILGQTSGGVEPMFAPIYKRYSNLGGKRRMEFNVYDHAILRWQKAVNANFPTDASDVTPETLNLLPPFFVFSHDIPWKSRVDLQGMAQKYVDSSISSTINLPADTSEDEVATIYMRAWRAGCKGVTVYRENCRENILETTIQVDDEDEKERQPKWVRPMSLRANSLSYKTHNQRVIVNFCDDENDDLREVQVIMGRSGDDMNAMCEALGRCISKLLQNGVAVGEIAESLRGIKAGETQWSRFDDNQEAPYVVRSVPDFIAAYIQHRYVRPEVERAATKVSSGTNGASRSGHKGHGQAVPVANEIQRGGDCPMCEGLDEFGR